MRDGCPRRPSAVTLASTPELTVTRTVAPISRIPGARWNLWRVCDRASHREAVMHQNLDDGWYTPDDVSLKGVAGPYVLLSAAAGNGHDIDPPSLVLYDARTGGVVRAVGAAPWDYPEPVERRRPARRRHIRVDRPVDLPARSAAVLTLAPAGSGLVELDAAAPGPQGLSVSGRTLSWTNGGVPRSYTLL